MPFKIARPHTWGETWGHEFAHTIDRRYPYIDPDGSHHFGASIPVKVRTDLSDQLYFLGSNGTEIGARGTQIKNNLNKSFLTEEDVKNYINALQLKNNHYMDNNMGYILTAQAPSGMARILNKYS